MRRICVDFETEAINGNPIIYPPRPVGVALYEPGTEPVYTADFSILERLWVDPNVDLVFHNAPFDTSVAVGHLGLSPLPWHRVHDTQFLLYLADPYAKTLSLKPSAERYLGMPNDEQNELHSWIIANVPGATEKNAGAYISVAPFELVARYAKGDVIRTWGIFDKLHATVPTEPYDRERRLSPILVQATQRGIRVAREALERATESGTETLNRTAEIIFEKLGCEIDLSSPQQLGARLLQMDALTEWKLTPGGRKSTSKKNTAGKFKDPALEQLLAYYSTLETCLTMFMRKWVALSAADGRVHPEWHQTRDTEGEKGVGTRTGRLSCGNPNMQNPPNVLGVPVPEGLSPLPVLRNYLLPEEGHIWLKRDFSQQEIRILAHFEEGALLAAYKENPRLDPHSMAEKMIYETTGKKFERKHVKITAFQIVYGGGPNAISGQVGCSFEEAANLRNAYLAAFPGVSQLMQMTKRRGDQGVPIRTWGGRLYYVEPPKMVQGRRRTFSYKLLNYLIQGSAADQTKQCLIDWTERYNYDGVFLATVHDEINISAPADDWKREMAGLKAAMDQDLFDCPMMSEGEVGGTWGSVKKLENE